MRMAAVTVLCLLFCVSAFAGEDPNEYRTYDIGWNLASYSRQGSVNLYGGDLSFAAHLNKRIAIVADLAAHQSTSTSPTIRTVTYRFGPRFSVNRGSRFTTFGEVLAGGSRLTGGSSVFFGGTTVTASQSYNGFAFAIGGGVDIGIRPWIAVRVVQFDGSILRFGELDTTSNGYRVGAGLVFRMGH